MKTLSKKKCKSILYMYRVVLYLFYVIDNFDEYDMQQK